MLAPNSAVPAAHLSTTQLPVELDSDEPKRIAMKALALTDRNLGGV